MTPRPENPSLRPSSAPEKQLITVLLNTIKYLAGPPQGAQRVVYFGKRKRRKT